ncbi:hypothetical protein GCM10027612_16810 [Microbispora bryophytorum subsp. camponoti]
MAGMAVAGAAVAGVAVDTAPARRKTVIVAAFRATGVVRVMGMSLLSSVTGALDAGAKQSVQNMSNIHMDPRSICVLVSTQVTAVERPAPVIVITVGDGEAAPAPVKRGPPRSSGGHPTGAGRAGGG